MSLCSLKPWFLPSADAILADNSAARYDPFGNYRTTPTTNPGTTAHGFTGHLHNNTGVYPTQNVGLIYMNARYYLPELGRFISADTIVPEPGNPQSYNRYAYTLNNPVNFTDPSGRCVTNDQEITRGDAYDCTVEEMSQLTWETRRWWLEKFMVDSEVAWFYNILGILDYFAGDEQFSDLNGWASLADAGVLIAIQDGWREYQKSGTAINNNSELANEAIQSWKTLFSTRKSFGDSSAEAAEDWGTAEQDGVDFGIALAEPLRAESDIETQIEIDTFTFFGNGYRALIINHADTIVTSNLALADYFDPKTEASRSFVYNLSRWGISPIARYLWAQYLINSNPH